MIRVACAAALVAALAIPASDATTKKCTIVDKKPTTTTSVQVGPVAFKTRTEAEAGMKTIKVCETK